MAAVQQRRMPPWLTTGDGTCGDFQDSMWLSTSEIDTIARWAAAGAPEGTPRTDLRQAEARTLGGEAVELATPLYRPEPKGDTRAHADDYRCFLVDPQVAPGSFITGYEVVPGTPAMIHHVTVMQVKASAPGASGKPNAEVVRALDAASPDRDGWPCYGLAGEGVEVAGIPVTWAPGMGVVRYPGGTGVPLTPDNLLVLQVHYNLSDPTLRGRPDLTKVRLRVDRDIARAGWFDLADNFLRTIVTPTPASLPPGRKQVDFTWEISYDKHMAAAGVPYFEVHGVFPHMHSYGRTQRVEIIKAGTPAAAPVCASEVRRWDFDWQLYYFYKQPLRLDPGDKLRVTCSFDTTGRTEPVLPGWGTDNEMCMAGLFLVPPAG